MNEYERLHAAEKSLIQWLSIANNYFSYSFPHPSLTFKLKGKCAGKAYLQHNEIRLNPILFEENVQEFIDDVIPHELAHLITYQRYGKVKPHGKEWQYLMSTVFHRQAKTTHHFDITSVAGKTFRYQCHCNHHQLSIRRHNNVQRNKAVYYCRHCQSPLMFMNDY